MNLVLVLFPSNSTSMHCVGHVHIYTEIMPGWILYTSIQDTGRGMTQRWFLGGPPEQNVVVKNHPFSAFFFLSATKFRFSVRKDKRPTLLEEDHSAVCRIVEVECIARSLTLKISYCTTISFNLSPLVSTCSSSF